MVDFANDYAGKRKFLGRSALFKAALHDTATLLMLANFYRPGHAGSEDEIGELLEALCSIKIAILGLLRCPELVQENLNNVVSIVAGAQCTGIFFEFSDQSKQLAV